EREAKKFLAEGRKAVLEHFVRLSEDKLDQNMNSLEFRRWLLLTALAYFQSFLKERQDDPELQHEMAEAHARVGIILTTLRRPEEALKEFQLCRTLREKLA